jgi:hypothetical protein
VSEPAEPMRLITTVSSNHATVEVKAEYVVVDGVNRPSRFAVTGPTGYRAQLPACLRDDCLAGKLTACRKEYGHIETVAAWLKHCQTYCHGWHEDSVERFALDVLSTYGAGVRAGTLNTAYGNKNRASRTVGVRRGSRYVRQRLIPAPGWPNLEAEGVA